MRICIVVIGFRNADDIAKCLWAIGNSDYRDYEVLICENGGFEAGATLFETLPAILPQGQPVTIVTAPANLGYGGGINLGIRLSPDADAWWVLNPDTQPEPGALSAGVARLTVGDCDAVGSTVYLPDGRIQCYAGVWQWSLARAKALGMGQRVSDVVDARQIERQQSYIFGASMLVSRRFVGVVGPLREDYFLYCEEVEWFLRGEGMGMRLGFAPEFRVLHVGGTTTGSQKSFRSMPKTPVYLNERNRILLTRDLRPKLLPIVLLTTVFVIVMRYGRRGAWRQLTYAIAGWSAGVVGRRGPPSWISADPYESISQPQH